MTIKRVLIVEDASFMRTLLRDTLKDLACEVCGEATDGEMGVRMYRELRPDLVTMDINMPKLDGSEALQQILAMDPKAKVVMCTTVGQEAMIKRCLLAGARDFMIKPFKKPQVLSTVERILRDNGAPQAFMEELVAWHELGEMLLRRGLVSSELLSKKRELVREKKARNIFEAFRQGDDFSESDLQEAFEDGHRELSMGFLLLKTQKVTMEQLRCAFVITRKTGKTLGFTLTELGFCKKDDIAAALKSVPPVPMLR